MEVVRRGEWAELDLKSTLRRERYIHGSLKDFKQSTGMIRLALWKDRWKFMCRVNGR